MDAAHTRGNADALLSAQQKVSHEINAIHSLLGSFKSRHNSLLLISRLPPELLACIFKILSLSNPPNSHHSGYHTSSKLGWIPVSHVCRHWREVALHSPDLWSDIAFNIGPFWTQAMLERSKSAPISISSSYSRQPGYAQFDPRRINQSIISRHLHHIQSIDLNGMADSDLIPFVELLNQPIPMLQEVRLLPLQEGKGPPKLALPNNLLNRHAPTLRSISLQGCAFPWGPFSFTCLVILEVKFRQPETAQTFDSSSFIRSLDMLANSPALESLTLHNCFPRSSAAPVDYRPIRLSNLTRLNVAGFVNVLVDVTKFLKFPDTTRLHLTCLSLTGFRDDYDSILPNVATHLAAYCETHPFHLLHIDNDTYTGGTDEGLPHDYDYQTTTLRSTLRMQALRKVDEPDRAVPSSIEAPDFRLTFSWPGEHSPSEVSLLEKACQIIPASDIQYLIVRLQSSQWTSKEFAHAFQHYMNVERVRAGLSAAIRLCEAMWTTPGAPSQPAPDAAGIAGPSQSPNSAIISERKELFPKLSSLLLQNVNFEDVVGGRNFSTALTIWLQNLREIDRPLEDLQISDCSVLTEWVDDIREAVDHLVWDGDEGELAESEELDYMVGIDAYPQEDYGDSDDDELNWYFDW